MNRTYIRTILALASLIAIVGSGCNAAKTAAEEEEAAAAEEEAAAAEEEAAGNDESTDVVPIAAPSNILFSSATSISVTVDWTSLSAGLETGFTLERSSVSDSSGFSLIATLGTGVTTYDDTGLAAATAYYYRVRAYGAGGDSEYSSVGSLTTETFPTGVLGSLVVWLKADSLSATTIDGGSVATWANPRLGGDATTGVDCASAPTFATNAINGRPVVRFNGLDQCLVIPDFGLARPESVFVVSRFATAGLDKVIVDGTSGIDVMRLTLSWFDADTITLLSGGASVHAVGVGVTNTHLYTAIYTTSDLTLGVDGGADAGLGAPSLADAGGVFIGARAGPSLFADVDIAEIVITSSAVSGADRSSVECYLGQKYGITLGHGC